MKKYSYRIERKNPHGHWRQAGPECIHVSREYSRGYLAAEAAHYPSYDYRVVNEQTGEVKQYQAGNGRATVTCKEPTT